jgi:hypothetical protein
MKSKTIVVSAAVALLVLLWAMGNAVAGPPAEGPDEEGEKGEVGEMSIVTSGFSYQGRLTDEAGNPVPDGYYQLVFTLYDQGTGGTSLAKIWHFSIPVEDGLFTAYLPFLGAEDQDLFDGKQLWLEVEVEGQTLSPRHRIRPVPYALSLRPGAVISDTRNGILTVRSTGSGDSDALYAYAWDEGEAVTAHSTNGIGVAAFSDTFLAVQGYSYDNTNNPAIFGCSADSAGTCDPYRDDAAAGVMAFSQHRDGIYVASAGDDGIHIHSAADEGVYVFSAGDDGIYVHSADDGVVVGSAANKGVYANTTQANHEWGIYTPDKMHAGHGYVGSGPLMLVAKNGDGRNLEAGDVVAVSGMGEPFADGDTPVPLVQKATRSNAAAAVGVVYRRFVAEEEIEEIEHEGKVERRRSIRTNSTEGPIAPGDYLLIVVLGPAQVKADASLAAIRPGDLLTAPEGGQALRAEPVKVGGTEFYPPGPIIGKAMEELPEGKGLIWVMVMMR